MHVFTVNQLIAPCLLIDEEHDPAKWTAVQPQPARRAVSVQSEPPARPDADSLFHVFPVLPKLPPQDGENDGDQQEEAAGHEVSDGKEVVLTPEPGQRGQDHLLLAVEGLSGKVWKGGGVKVERHRLKTRETTRRKKVERIL